MPLYGKMKTLGAHFQRIFDHRALLSVILWNRCKIDSALLAGLEDHHDVPVNERPPVNDQTTSPSPIFLVKWKRLTQQEHCLLQLWSNPKSSFRIKTMLEPSLSRRESRSRQKASGSRTQGDRGTTLTTHFYYTSRDIWTAIPGATKIRPKDLTTHAQPECYLHW